MKSEVICLTHHCPTCKKKWRVLNPQMCNGSADDCPTCRKEKFPETIWEYVDPFLDFVNETREEYERLRASKRPVE